MCVGTDVQVSDAAFDVGVFPPPTPPARPISLFLSVVICLPSAPPETLV